MLKFAAFACATALILPSMAAAETARFTVLVGDKPVGRLVAQTRAGVTDVEFDVKNNGRGPTEAERITLDRSGRPIDWTISGTTAFGSKVAESFHQAAGRAEWRDGAGAGSAPAVTSQLYLPQSGSPWTQAILASALLKAPNHVLPVLPAGTLRLAQGERVIVHGPDGPLAVTRYDLSGVNLTPAMLLLDARGGLFAQVDPSSIVIRSGYEAEATRLRVLAAGWSTARYVALERQVAHRYAGPVRIRNVRLFDPRTAALSTPVSVVLRGRSIAAVEAADSAATPGEVTIDGAGGTLVAGFYEMHGHLDQDQALLNLMAGITTVRDMGNDNAVLDDLVRRLDAGEIGGPHVIRSGFIEGKSPYSARNGLLVDSQAAALEAVRWYGARGYWQIKIYNSIDPAWVPAMVKEAHALGMRVAGHVPAFATADEMILAGYDEMTHINQVMLGWVMTSGEDTRTLFRLTGQKRLAGLDLSSPKVQRTLQLMVDRKTAIDPTLEIHEQLFEGRDGQVPPGAVDYWSHMPIGVRRDALKALIDTSAPGDDAAYRGAFETILQTLRLMHDRGIFMVFGTDTGGSFTYHRELELYQRVGFSAAEILKRATLDSARYAGQDQSMGSIEKGKLADFFLVAGDPTQDLKAIKAIRMVVKDGAIYFPSEVYPHFGIHPFATAPRLEAPDRAGD